MADAGFDKFSSARIDRWLAIVKAETKGAVSLTGQVERRRRGEDRQTPRKPLSGRPSISLAKACRRSMPGVKSITTGRPGFPTQEPADPGEGSNHRRWMPNSRTVCWKCRISRGGIAKPRWRVVPRNCRCRRISRSGATCWPMTRGRWRCRSIRRCCRWRCSRTGCRPRRGFDPRSTGRLQVKVSGTYADPVIDVRAGGERPAFSGTTETSTADLTIDGHRQGRPPVDGWHGPSRRIFRRR